MEINVGETVTWENVGSFPHTITSATFHRRAADWGIDTELTNGETMSYTFDRDGLYEYYCSSHGEANECGAVLVGDVSEVDDLPCDVV